MYPEYNVISLFLTEKVIDFYDPGGCWYGGWGWGGLNIFPTGKQVLYKEDDNLKNGLILIKYRKNERRKKLFSVFY